MKLSARMLIALALAGVSASCATPGTVATFPPAQSAHGIGVRVLVGQRQVKGELLDTRDEITEAYFSDVGIFQAADLEGAVAAQLRMMSRFPNGLSENVLRLLLRETRQTRSDDR